jgi:meso-butanediol dehydrogenase / (S,S)-butanediol dehydrogenase / diacetyl reductase
MSSVEATPLQNTFGIVTGAGSGIGREIALLALRRGATVLGLDISEAGLAQTRTLAGDRAEAFQGAVVDISDEAAVDRALVPLATGARAVDFLINAAGIEGSGDGIPDISVEHWDRIMGINLRGTFLTMRRVLPLMKDAGHGAIVNMGSVAALAGWAELASYTASKHGVLGLSSGAVAEFARYNVRINTICPGPTDTPLQDRAEANAVDPAEFRARQEKGIPQGRYGKPEEIAQLCLFLVGPESQYINGAVITIDGGMIATR